MKKIFKYLLFAFVCVMTLTATASVITVVTMKKNDQAEEDQSTAVVEQASVVVEENNNENNNENVVEEQQPEVSPVIITNYTVNSYSEEITKELVESKITDKAAVTEFIIDIKNNEEAIVIKENAFEGFVNLEIIHILAYNVTVETNAFKDSEKLFELAIYNDTVINENAFNENADIHQLYFFTETEDLCLINTETIANINLKNHDSAFDNDAHQITILFDNIKIEDIVYTYFESLDGYTSIPSESSIATEEEIALINAVEEESEVVEEEQVEEQQSEQEAE